MKRLLTLLNPFRVSGVAFLGLGLILIVVTAWFVFFAGSRERVPSLKLSMGREIQPPKSLTRFLLGRSSRFGVRFELVSTEGSEDTLARIERGEVDVAVVKGGIALASTSNVRQVTALDVELFHLLVKESIAPEAEKSIAALKGKSINPSYAVEPKVLLVIKDLR